MAQQNSLNSTEIARSMSNLVLQYVKDYVKGLVVRRTLKTNLRPTCGYVLLFRNVVLDSC